jgi:hypothetical protein
MLLTGWARAAGLRVAVVRSPDAAPLVREATTRLGAVLLAAGFDIVEVDARTEMEARRAIEQAGKGARVFATLALQSVANGTAIDVWIADSMTQKSSVRRVTIALPTEAATSREIALQGLDLLRASLLEVESPPSSWGNGDTALNRLDSRAVSQGRRASLEAKNAF